MEREALTVNEPAILETELPEDARAAIAEASVMLGAARKFHISTPNDALRAGEQLRDVVARRKEMEEARFRITRPMDEAKKKVMELFTPALAELTQAERTLKSGIEDYQAEQDRIAAEAQRKADDARRAEQNRLAAQAQAAREKAEAEAAELRRQAAEAESDAERARLEEKADQKIDRAEARAEAIEDRALSMPAAVMQSAAPKLAGISSRTLYNALVTDLMNLCRAVVNGQVPPVAILPNMVYLNQRATADKMFLSIPGVELEVSTSTATRR